MSDLKKDEFVNSVLEEQYSKGDWSRLSDEEITLIKGNCNSVAYSMYDALNAKIKYYETIIKSCEKAGAMIALESEVERKRQIIIAMQDCVGCGEPLWHEVQEMIEVDARIIAELQEPVIVDAVLKKG